MKTTETLGLMVLSLALAAPLAARASSFEPAGINLGGTSFMDGFGGTQPGFVYQQYFQIENYSAINDKNGNSMSAFQDPNISAVVSLNQLIYVSRFHLFGGTLGATALQPVVDLGSSFGSAGGNLSADSGLALGDLTWGPFLQMPPVIVGGRPVFDQRFEFDVISPIGQYNRADAINPSSGYWSLNPYWAMTVLPTANTELTARLHYLHNFENTDPAQGAAAYRAGDAVWANFAASYKVLPNLNLGVNGYYFQQIQYDTSAGQTIGGSLTTNFSIGPGAMYTLDRQNILFANVYLPAIERNTTDGFHLVFRWIHVF